VNAPNVITKTEMFPVFSANAAQRGSLS